MKYFNGIAIFALYIFTSLSQYLFFVHRLQIHNESVELLNYDRIRMGDYNKMMLEKIEEDRALYKLSLEENIEYFNPKEFWGPYVFPKELKKLKVLFLYNKEMYDLQLDKRCHMFDFV
jgi:hypothetical protein